MPSITPSWDSSFSKFLSVYAGTTATTKALATRYTKRQQEEARRQFSKLAAVTGIYPTPIFGLLFGHASRQLRQPSLRSTQINANQYNSQRKRGQFVIGITYIRVTHYHQLYIRVPNNRQEPRLL